MERQSSSGARTTNRKPPRRQCEALWDWNLITNRIHFSPGWIALVGGLEHELGSAPEDWFGRVHPDDRSQLSLEIDAARANGACEFELRYRLRHQDGTYRWMCSRGLVVRNDNGEAIRLTGTQVDVTVETVTDRQTGLPNRLLLSDRLTQSIARARRHATFHFALVLIDVGRPVSGPHQTRAGSDPLLNAAARRLETHLRTEELAAPRERDLVARVEGDQLAVLLDGLGRLDDAKAMADQILAALMTPLTLSGRDIRLSPVVGIALSASGYAHADEAIRDAETACHRARALGGSHCEVFDADLLTSAQSEVELEQELELALERDQFELLYQPIVSLSTSQVPGFEALVRWHHPVLGVISPLDFIPIAERTGLIVPLGRWILEEACGQLKSWYATVPAAQGVWISVNLSGIQLRDATLADQIADVLRRTGLPAPSLVLELTEGVAMDNPGAVTTVLMQLRAMGLRVSLDDFGTGYSSLAYLRQFPVDALKIDRSFVQRLATDKDTTTIVSGIVSMAKELGLYIVAEGVEDETQLATLRSLQCELAQGYLFAKPLGPLDAEDFLKNGPWTGQGSEQSSADGPSVDTLAPSRTIAAAMRSGMGRTISMTAAVVAVLLLTGVGTFVYRSRHTGHTEGPASGHLAVSSSVNAEQVASQPQSASVEPTILPGVPPPSGAVTTPPMPTPRSQPDSAATSASVAMAHLHRIGKCRGRLIVTRSGVRFVPDKKGSDDAFTLKWDEFVQTLDDKTLTFRTSSKTYRLEPAEAATKEQAHAQMTRLAATIARARVG